MTDNLIDPQKIKEAYDSLSDSVKASLGWKLVKQNKSWVAERNAVKAHLEQHNSIYLAEARELGLVPKDTIIDQFKKSIIQPLIKEGFEIELQRGVLPRNAVLYHTPGNAQVVTSTTVIFDEPTQEAAMVVVTKYINGFTGSINVQSELLKSKQFPFMDKNSQRKIFNRLIIDNLPKGCKGTSRPFVYLSEVKT